MTSNIPALISWPSAPFTKSLVRDSLAALSESSALSFTFIDSAPNPVPSVLLQWSTYDDLTHDGIPTHLSCSYVIRKALIRKHFLSRTIRAYVAKNQESILCQAVPKTFEVEIAWRDELDELWADELYELEQDLQTGKWWIIKPGMADRGMGIRLFNSKEGLESIFEDFEDKSDEEEGEEDTGTAVVTSQLRHFVVQEYLINPLLLDPAQAPLNEGPVPPIKQLQGHKFHLRVYVLASSALTLYMYNHILALFSSRPYQGPSSSPNEDLAAHLTNTSLQIDKGEAGVRLLRELTDYTILSGEERRQFTKGDIDALHDQLAEILSETWKAALGSPVHFQPLPNAFELFGVDFLVSHSPSGIQAHLLEINAEPAIELTGPRLSWILEEMFKSIGQICVKPFFQPEEEESWAVGTSRKGFRKCLEVQVRNPANAFK